MRAPALALAALLGLSGCVVAPPAPYPPFPAARYEVAPPVPGAGYVWIAGHWRWNGVTYAWIPGRYAARPVAYTRWLPGHWGSRGGAWVWVPGRWA